MNNYKSGKLACYITTISTAITSNLTPLLFLGFQDSYGISYSLLGLLVLINFLTQLITDLIFFLFAYKFPLNTFLKLTPFFIFLGLVVFSLCPLLIDKHIYLFLVIGTMLFAFGSGLSEVLSSPMIAAISNNDEKVMAFHHSVYAFGAFSIVLLISIALKLFSFSYWNNIALSLSLIPLVAFIIFLFSPLPEMKQSKNSLNFLAILKDKGMILCFILIFLGGAIENSMSSWCSSYLEKLGVSKIVGDLIGVSLFGLTLGIGRFIYAKKAFNIEKTLLFCFLGTSICYLVAIFSPFKYLALVSCALCGLTVSMCWPGTLILASYIAKKDDVANYALLAAGGDLGGSFAPQMIGIIADLVILKDLKIKNIDANVLGIKAGLLFVFFFALAGFLILLLRKIKLKKRNLS